MITALSLVFLACLEIDQAVLVLLLPSCVLFELPFLHQSIVVYLSVVDESWRRRAFLILPASLAVLMKRSWNDNTKDYSPSSNKPLTIVQHSQHHQHHQEVTQTHKDWWQKMTIRCQKSFSLAVHCVHVTFTRPLPSPYRR